MMMKCICWTRSVYGIYIHTTLPFVPDNRDGRISELLLDTTVVHPLPGPNSKHKLSLIEAKHNLRAADKACVRKKKMYDVICAQNGLKFLPIIFDSTGKMHPLLQAFLAASRYGYHDYAYQPSV